MADTWIDHPGPLPVASIQVTVNALLPLLEVSTAPRAARCLLRELAEQFGVSIITLPQALQLLADDAFIETRHGRGTYMTARYAYARAICAALHPHNRPLTISLPCGHLPGQAAQ